MEKLSDYRIKEKNGKFIIEGCVEITERRFLKKVINFEWHQLNVYGKVAGFSRRLDGMRVKEYGTLEEAKAKIVELCEEPKYHYVVPDYSLKELPNFALGQKRYKVQSVPSMNVPVSEYLNRFKYKVFPPVILEINQRRISPYDILYSAVRGEIITKSVDEICDLNDENSKLKEDYVSLHKKHTDMIDAYKDLNRKVEELRAMVSAKKK